MKMLTNVLVAILAIGLTSAQQTVVQPSTYPLTGFYQPLTFPSLPNTNVFQQQQQQQQQPSQQLQTTSTVHQQAALATVQQPTATTAFLTQPQQPANLGTVQQQQVAPPPSGPAAVVNSVRADGTYAFGYQTPDGQMRAESVQADGTTRGSYTYRTPEGQLITINYTAGRNGFQTSPGTTGSATAPASAPTVAEAPAPVYPAPSAPPAGVTTAAAAATATTSTGTSGLSATPLVLYTGVPQVSLSGYYPFSGFSAPSASAGVDQSGATSNADAEIIQPAQSQGTAYTATTPAIGTPVGFSYGSNPQAIQQLQRLLLV